MSETGDSKPAVAQEARPAHPMTLPGMRYTMRLEPPFRVRGRAFEWDHEVHVALPPSYDISGDTRYPVLWLTDGAFFFHLAAGILNSIGVAMLAPELIVVSVGCPEDDGMMEAAQRRQVDFSQGGDLFFDGPGGDYLRAETLKMGVTPPVENRADDFLSLFIDKLRPELSGKYRMSDDHALFGHSGGGMFASYAMFARPGAFRRFIIGSPSSNAHNRQTFRMEADYAAHHSDMEASVFLGAGEDELNSDRLMLQGWGIVSAPVLMAETLKLRQYPSLSVKARIFPGKGHNDVVPDLMTEGIKSVWADEAASLRRKFAG